MGKLHTLTHVRARGTQIHQSPLRRIEEETDPLAPGAGSKFSFFPACFWVSCRAVLTLCCLNESRGLFHSQVAAGLNTCRWLGADRGFNEVFWLQQKSHTQRFFKLHHSRVVGCCTTNQKVADWVKKKWSERGKKNQYSPLVKPIIKQLLEVIKQSDESDGRNPSREASPELSNIKNRFIPVSQTHLHHAAPLNMPEPCFCNTKQSNHHNKNKKKKKKKERKRSS